MKNKVIIAVAVIAILAGGAIYLTKTGKSVQNVASDGHTDHSHVATTTGSNSNTIAEAGAKLAGTRVILENTALKAGNQNIAFKLFGKDGHAFGSSDLQTVHEKKLHFIVVSDDFKEYLHLHPEFKDGTWSVPVTLKDNTSYQAYIDISPSEETPQVLRVPLKIGAPTAVSKVSQNNSEMTVGNITTSIKTEGAIATNHENSIIFNVKQGGKDIIPEQYLGALGHVIAVSHSDPNNFVHAHPTTHEGGDKDIHFGINFPTAGTYTLFAQFQVNGRVETYPFTVNATATHNEAEGHTDTAVPGESAVHH